MPFTDDEKYEIAMLIAKYGEFGTEEPVRRSAFNNLMGIAPASFISFRTDIGVGLGGIQYITRLGMTSLTDAGAAGLPPVVYDPTNNRIGIGAAAPQAAIDIANGNQWLRVFAAYVGMGAGGTAELDVTSTAFNSYVGGIVVPVDVLTALGRVGTGWLLAKGTGDASGEGSEFIDLDESIAAAVGSKWRIQTVTAASDINARGGVRRYETHTTTPCVLDGWKAVYDCLLAYRLYTRFAINVIANQRAAVGFVDAVPAVGAGSLAYTNDAAMIYFDTSVGGNYLLRTVVGGAAVDVDSGIAVVAGEYHQFDLLSAATKVITMYIDGTLRATAAAANCPLNLTRLRKVIYIDNIGAAVMATLDIDNFFPVQSRHTAVTA